MLLTIGLSMLYVLFAVSALFNILQRMKIVRLQECLSDKPNAQETEDDDEENKSDITENADEEEVYTIKCDEWGIIDTFEDDKGKKYYLTIQDCDRFDAAIQRLKDKEKEKDNEKQ